MIFAAGLGTRMRPLTEHIPKALIPIKGKPLIEIVIRQLIGFGYDEVVVNVHYHAQQIIDFLAGQDNFGITIHISDESETLLDTGGGLVKAAKFLSGDHPVLVCNVDVLSDIDLADLRQAHIRHPQKPIATLAVRKRPSERYLLFDEENLLCGWQNTRTGETRIVNNSPNFQQWAFSGIQIIDPKVLDLIDQKGVFSLIEVYLQLAKQYHIAAYDHTATHWIDVGQPQAIGKAEEMLPYLKAGDRIV